MGFNHIDLATLNMAATREFYEDILGFPVVRADIVELEAGGSAQHVFFDCGDGQMIAFASAENAPGRWPADLDTSLSKGLGLGRGVYHFAFEAGSLENLERLKAKLEAKGVEVRGIEDHEGWCRSIYFLDPNGLQLEYCCLSRKLTPEDAVARVRFRVSRDGKKLPALEPAAADA
jgi:catechol 2,3-dioxygenase-like lactoylglutathione lyase family enzyme